MVAACYSPSGFFVGQSCLSLNAHEDNWKKYLASELKGDYRILPMKVKVMRKPRLEIDEVEELPSYFRFAKLKQSCRFGTVTLRLLSRRNGGHLTDTLAQRPRGAPADWREDYDYADLNGDGIIDKQEYNYTMAKNLDRATRRWHNAKAVMKRSRAEQYATSRHPFHPHCAVGPHASLSLTALSFQESGSPSGCPGGTDSHGQGGGHQRRCFRAAYPPLHHALSVSCNRRGCLHGVATHCHAQP